jgi:glycosyltransferase involved in cell wall biosynthesis
MAVWEAMSNGLPVVSSDVGDLKLINQSAICSQIADRNPKALAQAILALIHDDKLRELQIKNARELVETQFSLEHHTQLYLQFCHEVVKHQERS